MKTEGSWSEGVRFSRADGSLTGTAGGPRVPNSGEPTGAAAAGSELNGDAARDAARDAVSDDAPGESSTPKALVDPSQARDALLALKGLQLPAPRAKALLRRVLAEQPAARTEELVRAVLRRHSA